MKLRPKNKGTSYFGEKTSSTLDLVPKPTDFIHLSLSILSFALGTIVQLSRPLCRPRDRYVSGCPVLVWLAEQRALLWLRNTRKQTRAFTRKRRDNFFNNGNLPSEKPFPGIFEHSLDN
jgi:hypothetical protein